MVVGGWAAKGVVEENRAASTRARAGGGRAG